MLHSLPFFCIHCRKYWQDSSRVFSCEKRSAEHEGVQRDFPLAGGSCVAQLPSCHEEPLTQRRAEKAGLCLLFLSFFCFQPGRNKGHEARTKRGKSARKAGRIAALRCGCCGVPWGRVWLVNGKSQRSTAQTKGRGVVISATPSSAKNAIHDHPCLAAGFWGKVCRSS